MLLGAIVALAGDAAGEAQLASGGATAKLVAAAHVDFRIIIPPTLGLTISGARHAAVQSNGRSVSLMGSNGTAVLTAVAHGVIERDTPCANVKVCTAATP